MSQTNIDYSAVGKKMYYTISEVCQLTGLKDSVLRHWETEIPKLRPKKNRGGNRAYQTKDIELVLFAKQLIKDEGLSLQAAKQRIADTRSESRAAKKTKAANVDAGIDGDEISNDIREDDVCADRSADINADTNADKNINNDPKNIDDELQLELFPKPPAVSPATAELLSEIRSGLEDVLRLLHKE